MDMMQFPSQSVSNGNVLVVLVAIWTFFTIIFWMVVGWRAMRAHETLASANENLAEEIHQWRLDSERRLALKKLPSSSGSASSSSVLTAEDASILNMLSDEDKST